MSPVIYRHAVTWDKIINRTTHIGKTAHRLDSCILPVSFTGKEKNTCPRLKLWKNESQCTSEKMRVGVELTVNLEACILASFWTAFPILYLYVLLGLSSNISYKFQVNPGSVGGRHQEKPQLLICGNKFGSASVSRGEADFDWPTKISWSQWYIS